MGLLVWMPLTGNINNQGLINDIPQLLGSGSAYTSGRIGQSLNNNGTGYVKYADSITLSNTFTFSLWAKMNSMTPAWARLFSLYKNANVYIGMCTHSNGTSLGFHVYDYINDAKTDVTDSYTWTNVEPNEWHHYAVVLNGRNIRYYLDGILIRNATINYDYNTTTYTVNQLFTINGGTKSNCCLNDFRIYNHCLSDNEVKRISQALTLHYSLSNRGFGGDNLVPCGGTYTYTSPLTTSFSREDGYAWVPNSAFEGQPSTTYTISVQCDGTLSDRHGMPNLTPLDKPWTFWLYISNVDTTKSWQSGQYDTAVNLNSKNHNYRKIGNTHVWTYTLSSSQKYISLRTNSYSDGETVVTVNWWNIKIEQGNRYTPWVPNSADALYSSLQLGSTTEFDLSGYQYNAIKNSISNSSDSPINQGCYVFNGTNSWVKCDTNAWMVQGATEFTASIWAYAEDWTTQTNAHLFSCTESGGFNTGVGASGYLRFPRYVYTNVDKTSRAYQYNNNGIKLADLTPGWHMFTMIYTLTGEQIYIDGELHSSANYTSYGISFNTGTRLFLGCEAANSGSPGSPYFNGKLADYRFYYTALDEDAIKELYEMGAAR